MPDTSLEREIAHRLDCFTEGELLVMTGATEKTVESWRKRGTGPSYYRAGLRYLYPREAIEEWLKDHYRERNKNPPVSDL